jgi:hypothetical protein
MSALPPVPQAPAPQQPQQSQAPVDPSGMLQAMGQPQGGGDPAQGIQQIFVQLAQGIDQFMQQVQDLGDKFPAFQPHAQKIGQMADAVHSELNSGMMDAIQQLRGQEPQAPQSQY